MVINFGAGPAKLPEEVLLEVQKDLLHYGDSEMSVMEMSHRGKHYSKIHQQALETIREVLKVPSNFKILLMQGGGTGIFAAVCMNLMGTTGVADYFVTGQWSSKAAKEAFKYGKVNMVLPSVKKYTEVPPQSEWNLDPNAAYVYYCDNETIEGVEFDAIPETNGVTLVCDMSSNIATRSIDFSKFGLIFAGAQKNIGTAGITLVIVREDLIGKSIMQITPTILDFSIVAKDNSINNTPPTFCIYVMGRVFEWIKRHGGIEGMQKSAAIKSQMIYKILDETNGFYKGTVNPKYRSRMNVPFRIPDNEALEEEFLQEAEKSGMVQLRGHRAVGGIRASLYNAITLEETETLANYMIEFYKKHTKN